MSSRYRLSLQNNDVVLCVKMNPMEKVTNYSGTPMSSHPEGAVLLDSVEFREQYLVYLSIVMVLSSQN